MTIFNSNIYFYKTLISKSVLYNYQQKRYMEDDNNNSPNDFFYRKSEPEHLNLEQLISSAEQELALKNYEYNDLFYVQGALTATNVNKSGCTKEEQKQFFENLLARLKATENKDSEMQLFREAFEQQIHKVITELEKLDLISSNTTKQLVDKATQTEPETYVENASNTVITPSLYNVDESTYYALYGQIGKAGIIAIIPVTVFILYHLRYYYFYKLYDKFK